MARRLRNNILAIKFNKKELDVIEKKLKNLIEKAKPKISLDVAKRVHNDINASGNIPVDTGKLKGDTTTFQDKYDKNFATMGWFMPYAKQRYYGVHGERVWKTIDGKRRQFTLSETGKGIPFWDVPFTHNTQYMIRMYEWAFRKSKLGK